MVPKFHGLWHIGFESQFFNPEHSKCYINEDALRRMKALAMSTRYGVAPARRGKR